MLTGTDITVILDLNQHLYTEFGIKDRGAFNYFLGIEISYLPNDLFLSQKKFTHELLDTPSTFGSPNLRRVWCN